MNYQAPQIQWKTERETETDGFCSYEANTATHKYRIYYSDTMKSWMCTYYRFSKPETKHKYLPTSQELKEWVETTHYPSALIKAGFKPVSEPLSDTLIEKLDEYHQSLYERWYDNHKHPYDEGAMDAAEKAINIVKQHEAESEVQDD